MACLGIFVLGVRMVAAGAMERSRFGAGVVAPCQIGV
jgi:hypothetical protein